MDIEDIRIRKTIIKKEMSFLGIKYTKTILKSNTLEVKYADEWVKIKVFRDEKIL